MHAATPKVFLLARPSLDWEGIQNFLEEVGGEAHMARAGWVTSHHGSLLTEIAGRACYRSWEAGLNPNVTKIREDRADYLANVLNSKHGSVLEHANYTFAATGVSRVFTHELVRHRAGWAFSQESMRYVRLDDLGFSEPDIFPSTVEGDLLRKQSHALLDAMEKFQLKAAEVNDLDSLPFGEKKRITSAMRRYAPDGLATTIIFTANVRALRWVTELRTDPSAEVEIRNVFDQVGEIMIREEPDLWQDFVVTKDGAWTASNRKA
jgi:thymidylate synthase (FAD)